MRGKSMAGYLVAALAASFASAPGATYYEPGFGLGSRGSSRARGPGWTHAQMQRMARKKRNQARHRKACR